MSQETVKINKRIIRKESIKLSLIGVLTAFFMLTIMFGPSESTGILFYFFPNILLGTLFMILSIFVFSHLAAKEFSRKISPVFLGILIALFSFYIGSFFGSLYGYITLGTEYADGFHDYVFKPTFALLIYGSIPTLIFGLILGMMLRKKIQRD
jgi:hypothetical protein